MRVARAETLVGHTHPSGSVIGRRALIAGLATLAAASPTRKPRAAAPDDATDPRIGELQIATPRKKLPALIWMGMDGAPDVLANYAGRGLVLNFWATWCSPCAAEMPSLDALAAQIAPDRIAVVAVSADSGGPAAVRRFYADHHIAHLGVWCDPHQRAMAMIGAAGLPTTLIIDRAGREAARIAGAANWTAPGTVQTIKILCAA